MQITKTKRNVHRITLQKRGQFLLISDLHFDNPECNRDLLKKHLDEALKRNAGILVNGDFFCLMQGRGDPRRSKENIRPEHNNGRYLDSVIEEAVQWWEPYAKNLLLVGYGNHERSIIKHQETDILARFVGAMNQAHKSPVQTGGYSGVVIFASDDKASSTFALKYYHGHGGGGIVTKGVIQNQRMMAATEGYDAIWQGHVHELYHHVDVVEIFDRAKSHIKQRSVHIIRTSTYKEEFADGYYGFHVERGAPPKPLGGYWLRLELKKLVNVKYLEPKFETCL